MINVNKINKCLLEKGWTKYKLAKEANIGQSTLSEIMKGLKKNPRMDTIEKIADALDVSLDYLSDTSVRSLIESKLEDMNMSAEQLCDTCNIPTSFIENLEDIQPTPEDYEILDKVAEVLDIDTVSLRTALSKQDPEMYEGSLFSPENDFQPLDDCKQVSLKDFIQIPIVGTVRAGIPILAQDNIESYHPTLKSDLCSDKSYFYLRVQGDSMNQEFNEGALLLIEKVPSVENGTIAVVLIDGQEATVKKVIQNGNMITLIPMSTNTIYVPKMYDIKKDKIQIIGKVKQAIKTY